MVINNKIILNIVLKRYLEWGKKMLIPLKTKLLKDIPDISTDDLKKLVDYIKNISDDILWNIYYNNYDRKTDKLKIDVSSEIRKNILG